MIQAQFTLKEAAELAGVSKVTLWRLVQKGELEASQDDKGRYTLERETVMKYRETLQRNTPNSAQRFNGQPETPESFPAPNETASNVSQPEPETIQPRSSSVSEAVYETVEMVSAELHRLALESARHALESSRRAEDRADRAERQMEILSGQLIQYQRALQERAESLAEKEAIAKQAVLLAEENAQRLSLYEQEKHQWLLELETTKTKINWLEKKVPRWVRGLFGAR